MELLDMMKQRYSVREFESKQIKKDELDKILQAGRVAPTACNRQPQRILILQSKNEIEKLKKCTPFTFDAPTILLICQDKTSSWIRKYDGKDHGEIDTTIVTTQMMLEAFHLGIGSTWVCSFDPQKLKEEFQIPDHYEPIHLLPIGYPKIGNTPSKSHHDRYKLEKTVFYKKF